MATAVHCVFCFEILSASLDSRPALSLSHIQELWEQYQVSSGKGTRDDEGEGDSDETDEEPTSRRPRLRTGFDRLIAPSISSASSSSVPSTISTSSSKTHNSSLGSSSNSSASSFFSTGRKVSAQSGQAQQQAPTPSEERPLFVTWNAISSRSGSKSLRGCIGTFEAQPLEQGLKSYALTSAFEDSRFMPITKRELSGLEVGVTLLTDFEPAPNPTSWDLGKHGIRISFTHHSKRYGATYLPDVALDQGWTKEETLISLMRKAGWSGRRDDWHKVGDLQVVRYQGKKMSMKYNEWSAWRKWIEMSGLL
ncbi:MAG: hypothetical protein M1825_004901 [Sarcosagium campestre]|nr:MAG: hypothetical protein M1825_004901 [Sarcosagium campestre]